ncbi:unnamed protein product [Gadus morhua 'NCC']
MSGPSTSEEGPASLLRAGAYLPLRFPHRSPSCDRGPPPAPLLRGLAGPGSSRWMTSDPGEGEPHEPRLTAAVDAVHGSRPAIIISFGHMVYDGSAESHRTQGAGGDLQCQLQEPFDLRIHFGSDVLL